MQWHQLPLKKILLDVKTQIDPNTATEGDFNTPFSCTDSSSGQKLNSFALAFYDSLNQMVEWTATYVSTKC